MMHIIWIITILYLNQALFDNKCLTQFILLTSHMVLCFEAKNVAADIASQLCDSVARKLEGKVMGTFTSEYTC